MNRRGFFSILGLVAAFTTIPIATLLLILSGKKTPPIPVEPITEKTNWRPAVGISTGQYYRPTIDIVDEEMNRCQMTVGGDGCLWVRPNGEGEWFRVELENNL
jgi:hypothetical protein